MQKWLIYNEVESFYQCTFCNEDWELSIPDYSWRGYFLPKQSTVLKHQSNERDSSFKTFQRKGKNGCGCCLGMIFLFILLILYALYKFFDILLDAIF